MFSCFTAKPFFKKRGLSVCEKNHTSKLLSTSLHFYRPSVSYTHVFYFCLRSNVFIILRMLGIFMYIKTVKFFPQRISFLDLLTSKYLKAAEIGEKQNIQFSCIFDRYNGEECGSTYFSEALWIGKSSLSIYSMTATGEYL